VRTDIQQFADDMAAKHDLDKVAQIRVAKIYPNNIDVVIHVGAKQRKAAYHFVNHASEAQIAKDTKELEAALEVFEFKGSLTAAAYGPVRDESDIFDSRMEEASADVEASD